jgi:hypothetical protein
MNMHVLPDAAPVASSKPPVNIERLHVLVMRQLGAFELIGDLARAAKTEDLGGIHESLLDHVELIADTFADTGCEALDMLQSMLYAQDEDAA